MKILIFNFCWINLDAIRRSVLEKNLKKTQLDGVFDEIISLEKQMKMEKIEE